MQVKFSVMVAIIIVKLVLCMYKQATVKTGLQLVLVVKISWVCKCQTKFGTFIILDTCLLIYKSFIVLQLCKKSMIYYGNRCWYPSCVNDHMMRLPIAIRQNHHILKEHQSSMPLWSELRPHYIPSSAV